MGNKEGGKRINKKVIQYLQAYFHAGNLNPKDRYIAEKMHESLKELAHENELSVKDILEVKTIKRWIERYSAFSKKKMSKKELEQCALEESSLIMNTTHNRASKRQKRG
ncbi:uncharacterized protein OCT59_021953 [Rhizophagus irregularis]|uniref:Uncharacterized protein n=1 Tax=Rhizophagus irregularis (strain DAOM 197198w) TaxID=1432141 RepID=A0A015IB00_RHIIW|nr:hypothetical protein RirG_265620 [Rhizophagus irregularis DAOM 197198w]UZO28431.1 hypothetical protein OCT59_021953 [Rhizophagus irregularis]GET63286.1 hypothetical protein GLOIN_2v1485655 [Rhizophagus irregularis DAOM 181602=DAOM 197198]CAG8649102.1 3439_t:CDS:1 [Rhizophagus irregularis]